MAGYPQDVRKGVVYFIGTVAPKNEITPRGGRFTLKQYETLFSDRGIDDETVVDVSGHLVMFVEDGNYEQRFRYEGPFGNSKSELRLKRREFRKRIRN